MPAGILAVSHGGSRTGDRTVENVPLSPPHYDTRDKMDQDEDLGDTDGSLDLHDRFASG